MNVVTLVPWRGGDELREHNWRIVRPYLERLGYPVITRDRPGAWSRAAAVNTASKAAGDWDVVVIADADTVPEAGSVHLAVGIAMETGGGVRPHDTLWRLTRQGSALFAHQGPRAITRRHTTGTHLGGGLLVVSRAGWDAVGGYDERFVGWGHEDSAFGLSLVVDASWDRVPGQAWHLWHPAPAKDTPAYRRNRELLTQQQASSAQAVRAASRAKGFDVGQIL